MVNDGNSDSTADTVDISVTAGDGGNEQGGDSQDGEGEDGNQDAGRDD